MLIRMGDGLIISILMSLDFSFLASDRNFIQERKKSEGHQKLVTTLKKGGKEG